VKAPPLSSGGGPLVEYGSWRFFVDLERDLER